MILRRQVLWLIVCISVLSGCDVQPAAEVAYLEVNELSVSTTSDQGTSSSKLNTLWVEQNGQQLGAFMPPCRIPLLAGNDQEIRLIPGISINGSYNQRNQYEMLNAKSFNWDLEAFSTRTLGNSGSTFSYNSTYTLRVIEDFDGVGLNFSRAVQSDTTIIIVGDEQGAFEFTGENPNKSGKVVMLPASRAEFRTPEAFELPQQGANVWLEVNYKTDVPLTFGVIANETLQSIQAPVVTLFANEDWNKVYLNLVTEVSGYPGAGDFNLFFGAINNTEDTANIFIDNIKLLY